MVDALLQMAFSNTCFALAIAGVAVLVGARGKRPRFAHALWLLVFVRLVTPPALTIPIALPQVQPTLASMAQSETETSLHLPPGPSPTASLLTGILSAADQAKPWLVSIWLIGSAVVLTWSLVRMLQFDRLLRAHSAAAPPAVQTEAETIARRLALSVIPEVSVTTAYLSPMVWWTGGRVRIVLPVSLLEQMEPHQWRWVLAHELAHVRRRDYLVRWLEWLVGVGFWWNPLVWWARRHLRATEEICCDALVLSTLKTEPHTYAASILTAAESLVRPVLRPPAMASEMSSCSFLERRLSMMITDRIESTACWRVVRASVLVLTVGLLPLGIGCSSEDSPVSPESTNPSAKAVGTETASRLSGVQNNEDGSGSGRATQNDGVDWRALMATPPEEWSDELKAQITAAGYDLKETTDGIRQRQAWAAVAGTPSEDWTQEQRDQLIGAGLDPEEVAARMRADRDRDGRGSEGVDIEAIGYRIREIEKAITDGRITPEEGRRLIEETRRSAEADDDPRDGEEALREFQRGVGERAMAIPPEEWDDGLKEAIVRAGWDLNGFTEGIRQRQAAMREGETAEDSRESEDDRIWREALATDPDEWSEELKAQLLELAPGRTIEDIAGWIRQRQAAMRKGGTTNDAGDGG